MKKWRYTFLAVVAGISATVQGQNIVWGKSYSDSADVSVHNIIGSDADGFYVTAKIYPHKSIPNYMPCILLRKYDYSGNELFSHALVMKDPANNKPCPDQDVLFMKHTMLLSSFLTDNSTNRLNKINTDGSIDKKGIDIANFKAQHKALKGYLPDSKPDSTCHFVLSSDSTTLLAYYTPEDDKHAIAYKIIKEDLTLVKNGTTRSPFDEDCTISDATVSGSTAYFFGKEKKEKVYKLFTINKMGDVKTFSLSPDGTDDQIGSYKLQVDSVGGILFEGFYNAKHAGVSLNAEGPVGYFVMKLDGMGKVTMNKSVAFDKDLLLRYHPTSRLEQGVGGYYGTLTVKNIIQNPDNSQVLVAEISQHGSITSIVQGNMVDPTRPMSGGTGDYHYNVTTVYYTYGDILIFKINPDGSLASYHDYVKRQENDKDKESADNIFSFGSCTVGNTMYMMYNDNEKNVSLTTADMLTKDDDFKKAKFGDLELMVQPVDLASDNLIEKKVLLQYTGDDEKSNVYPPSCYQVGDKIIIYKHNDKKETGQFGQVVLQ